MCAILISKASRLARVNEESYSFACHPRVYCCRMACGDMSFTVFVGHAVNEISEVRQQISRRQSVSTGRYLAHLYIAPCCTSFPKLVKVGPRGPLGRQNSRFSYIVRPSAMKFGSVRGITNRHLCLEFRELWSAGVPRYHAATCISLSLLHLSTYGISHACL